jgi:hypothetical protein
MYYVARYFAQADNRSDVEQRLAQELDANPAARSFLRSSLDYYLAIPEETKLVLFDRAVLAATANIHEPLPVDLLQQHLSLFNPALVVEPDFLPDAPSELSARNAYQLPNPDIAGSAKYQIELQWQDNSIDEDGFFIYRLPIQIVGEAKPPVVATVGRDATTYLDSLSSPPTPTEQYCYWVTAFKRASFSLVDQAPPTLESGFSGPTCSSYGIVVPPPFPDSDNDGVVDAIDKCPNDFARTQAWGIEGCPDFDSDGFADKDDACYTEWGERPVPGDTAIAPLPGCPYKYTIRWMHLVVLNNSAPVAYPQYTVVGQKGDTTGGKPVELYNEGNDSYPYGEEPYLLFGFVNGMHHQGMPFTWTTRWCCGERVMARVGDNIEPDQDFLGEESSGSVPGMLDHGLIIYPGLAAGRSAEIDRELGLIMNVTLMERDWTRYVTPEGQQAAFGASFNTAVSGASAIYNCYKMNAWGCMNSIGNTIKSIIEWFLEEKSKPVEVTDPDDYMGSDIWLITREQAQVRTARTGGYGFWFDMPSTYYVSCLGAVPCPLASAVPVTMRVRLEFCLHRDGVPEDQVRHVCSPPSKVMPG